MKSPPPGAQAGTYRLINKHRQCVLQVAAGDHRGCHGADTARLVCHIANSLPLCQGEQLVMGEHEQRPKITPPPTNKHTNPCTFPLCCHKTLESFPQVASTAESYRTGKNIMSEFILLFFFPLISSPLLEASVACVFACTLVCLFTYREHCSLGRDYVEESTHQAQNHWGLSGAVNTL